VNRRRSTLLLDRIARMAGAVPPQTTIEAEEVLPAGWLSSGASETRTSGWAVRTGPACSTIVMGGSRPLPKTGQRPKVPRRRPYRGRPLGPHSKRARHAPALFRVYQVDGRFTGIGPSVDGYAIWWDSGTAFGVEAVPAQQRDGVR